MFAPERVSVPAPAFVRLMAVVPFPMAPPSVRVLALAVMVRVVPAAVPSVTAPVPQFSPCVPAKVKSPLIVPGGVVVQGKRPG